MKTLSGLAKEFRVNTHSNAAVRISFVFIVVLEFSHVVWLEDKWGDEMTA
jgi:hypothetical protein